MKILQLEQKNSKSDDWVIAITPNREGFSHQISTLENYINDRMAYFELGVSG
jgi:hypothetical protein